MRAKVWAVWLVLLILSPFSAPFSTCDLATFFQAPDAHHTTSPATPGVPRASDNSLATHALTVTRITSRDQVVRLPQHSAPLAASLTSRLTGDVTPVMFLGSRLVSPLRI